MEHVLWVVLVALLGVNDQGKPTIEYEVHSTHMRQQDCYNEAEPMIQAAKSTPRVDVQCVPVPHSMIL